MRIQVEGFSFDFPDAIDAFVFDEKDKSKQRYHGSLMKAVDIVVEFRTDYVYVEMKVLNPDRYNNRRTHDEEQKSKNLNLLKSDLKYKYRDSFLFRYAEGKVEKPIHYVCLLNLDNAQMTYLQKWLKIELPTGKSTDLWQKEIVKSCQVVSVAKWNSNFPKWPLNTTT